MVQIYVKIMHFRDKIDALRALYQSYRESGQFHNNLDALRALYQGCCEIGAVSSMPTKKPGIDARKALSSRFFYY